MYEFYVWIKPWKNYTSSSMIQQELQHIICLFHSHSDALPYWCRQGAGCSLIERRHLIWLKCLFYRGRTLKLVVVGAEKAGFVLAWEQIWSPFDPIGVPKCYLQKIAAQYSTLSIEKFCQMQIVRAESEPGTTKRRKLSHVVFLDQNFIRNKIYWVKSRKNPAFTRTKFSS